jgi:F-box and leucine-rich repeat protein GRR1
VLNLQGNRSVQGGRPDAINDLLDSSLLILACQCKLLEYINFSYRERITDDGMIPLLKSNKHLVRLFCVRCFCLSSGTIVGLSKFCEKLEILNISCCDGEFFDDCLMQLALGCPQLTQLGLQHLNPSSTAKITLESMNYFVKNCKLIQNIQRSPPNLSYSRKNGFFVRSFPSKIVPELDVFG